MIVVIVLTALATRSFDLRKIDGQDHHEKKRIRRNGPRLPDRLERDYSSVLFYPREYMVAKLFGDYLISIDGIMHIDPYDICSCS